MTSAHETWMDEYQKDPIERVIDDTDYGYKTEEELRIESDRQIMEDKIAE